VNKPLKLDPIPSYSLIKTIDRCQLLIGIFFILLTANFAAPFRAETLRINEFMALNSTTLADEDGDYSDWIEIYNPTPNAIDLLNWSLTDDKANTLKWKFPQVFIIFYPSNEIKFSVFIDVITYLRF